MADWSSIFEPPVQLIWFAAAGMAGLCATLVAALLGLSFRQQTRQRHLKQVDEQWAAWVAVAQLYPVAAPAVSGPGYLRHHWAARWLNLLLKFDTHSQEKWVQLAHQAGLADYALKTLRHPWRTPVHRVEVCATLAGILRLEKATHDLEKLAGSRSLPLSFASCVALARLDPSSVKSTWARAQTDKWSVPALLTLLKLAPLSQAESLVQQELSRAASKRSAKLLLAWGQLAQGAAQAYANQVLVVGADDSWLLCAALKLQQNPAQVPLVKSYLKHPRWAVRLQAVRALARLGTAQDLKALPAPAEQDPWWLRQRTKEALLKATAQA